MGDQSIIQKKLEEQLQTDIAERRRIEAALRASEAKYRTLIETTDTGFLIIDLEGRVQDANQTYVRLTGHRELSEILGRNVTEWTAAHDQQRNAAALAQCVREGLIRHFVIEYVDENGRKVPVEINATVSGVGDSRRIISLCRDITKRQQASAALEEIEALLSNAFSNSPLLMTISDLQTGKYLTVNDKFCLVSGFSREEAIGKTSLELGWIGRKERRRLIAELEAHGKVAGLEILLRSKTGKAIACRYWGGVIKTAKGDKLFTTAEDLTEKKQAAKALREKEKTLNSIINAAPIALWRLDAEGILLLSEGKALAQLGIKAGARIGKSVFELYKNAPEVLALIRRGLNGEEFSAESQVGGRYWSNHYIPCRDEQGDVIELIGVSVDITDSRRAEQDRMEMERRLLHSQKLESLGVLAGGIAHDFNNLLMTILGNLELAMDDVSPLSSARPYLENTRKAARHAVDLTRQMLAYSGKGNFVIENVNISDLLQDNIHMWRSSIPATIALNLHLTPDIPYIMADPGQIQQVVMNLLTNAAEAIGDKSGTIDITTGFQDYDKESLRLSRLPEKSSPGNFIYLEVADTGCGMDEDTQQRIFEPFFTTKFTGRGLGMSALQGIVLGHKGAIFLDSKLGKGTTIRVIFPASDTDALLAPQAPAVTASASCLTSAPPAPSGIILVVDDEDNVRQLCGTMLTRSGYRTLTAADGEEAIKVFQDHAGDIACVILDLTMPKMDGYATFQALKKLCPDVKIIMSSGYNEETINQRFAGLGLSGFIQKPYRRQQLQDELERVIKGG